MRMETHPLLQLDEALLTAVEPADNDEHLPPHFPAAEEHIILPHRVGDDYLCYLHDDMIGQPNEALHLTQRHTHSVRQSERE